MIQDLINLLDTYFPNPQVPLFYTSNYTLLIAVLLSQQSTDKKVNEITPKLFALADTPEKMWAFDEDELRILIRPIGLSPQKAHNIRALSRILIDDFHSIVPNTLEELTSLPGVGRKTALCVLAQAFHQPAFPVDTHIFRLAHRWGLSNGKTPLKVEQDLTKIFPKNLWSKVHLQMIYAGRSFCKAAPHDPKKCPFCSLIH